MVLYLQTTLNTNLFILVTQESPCYLMYGGCPQILLKGNLTQSLTLGERLHSTLFFSFLCFLPRSAMEYESCGVCLSGDPPLALGAPFSTRCCKMLLGTLLILWGSSFPLLFSSSPRFFSRWNPRPAALLHSRSFYPNMVMAPEAALSGFFHRIRAHSFTVKYFFITNYAYYSMCVTSWSQ